MLKDKIAIVTGGGTGIGAATARLLAENGAHVVVTSEQPIEKLAPVCDEIGAAGGSASAVSCDITNGTAIAALIDGVRAKHGRLDILVNCAGVFFMAPLGEMSEEQIRLMFEVNTLGPIFLTRTAIPLMRESGGGAIVNISSGAAMLGVENCAAYAASKSAIAHFTRTFAPELKGSGIRVNAIGPGSVRTPMLGFVTEELTPEQQESMVKREANSSSPYGNGMIEPRDIAQVVLFLASDAGRALHGSYVLADQGISSVMRPPG